METSDAIRTADASTTTRGRVRWRPMSAAVRNAHAAPGSTCRRRCTACGMRTRCRRAGPGLPRARPDRGVRRMPPRPALRRPAGPTAATAPVV